MAEDWNTIEGLVCEVIEGQHARLLKLGRQMIPTLTSDDILQPNDYPELENSPHFRYEEGILAGMQALQMALQARRKEEEAERLERS